MVLSYEGFIDLVKILQNLEADNINAVMRFEWMHDTIKKAVFCKSNPYHDELGRFASRESLYIKTAEKAHSLFPNETWIKYSDNVFVAESRKPKNKHQREVFEKEIKMAEILAKHGHIVCMLPESSDNTAKHPDAVVDGILTEFKEVTGSILKVGARFHDAKKQADNVFLKIDSDMPVEDVYDKLKGEVAFHGYKSGRVYVYLNGKMYNWNIKRMK